MARPQRMTSQERAPFPFGLAGPTIPIKFSKSFFLYSYKYFSPILPGPLGPYGEPNGDQASRSKQDAPLHQRHEAAKVAKHRRRLAGVSTLSVKTSFGTDYERHKETTEINAWLRIYDFRTAAGDSQQGREKRSG